jgi:gliding motility-associated-like protein
MKKVSYIVLLYCLVMLSNVSFADHIVGGEIKMRPFGGVNSYQISLIQFWDENNLSIPSTTVSGNRDPRATLYIYKKNANQLVDSVLVTYQSSKSVTYQNKSCATARSMKTLQGTYNGTVTLIPQRYSDPEGYYIVWERCCRNGDINNIKTPGQTGMVFYLEFPPVSLVNSSPEFQFPNGQYICVNRSFSMNMSAVDADGDDLFYSLVTPMRGNTSALANMSIGNSSPKSGYPLVTWENGISAANAIPGSVPLNIGSRTGILNVTASAIGLYVFAIQCEEFRNGKRIGLARRDFQLLVIDCGTEIPDPPLVMFQAQPAVDVKFCPERPIQLETVASNQWSYQWQLNGLNIPGAITEKVMVIDTGTYTVVKSYKTKCTSDTTSVPVKVSYADPVFAKITVDKPVLCKGEVAILEANSTGASAGKLTYTWWNGGKKLEGNHVQVIANESGEYKLEVAEDGFGCTGRDSVVIAKESIEVSLPEKLTTSKGSVVSVTAVVMPSGTGRTYLWGPVDSGLKSASSDSSVLLGPSVNTTYTVEVTSSNGCTGKDSVEVSVIDRLHIPDAFSPDQNGVNDKFVLYNQEEQILEVLIYNRWGNVVFHSIGYESPWDGSYKNTMVPPGYYPYIIKTRFGDYKGEVFVLR